MYPEKRLFKRISKLFCQKNDANLNVYFLTTKAPLWKLIDFNDLKDTVPKINSKKYTNELLFLKFTKPIRNNYFDYFTCKNITNKDSDYLLE